MSQNSPSKPPWFAKWLASRFIDKTLREEFLGDLQEIYEDRLLAKGKLQAKAMYWIDVMHLLTGFSSIHLFKNRYKPTIMFRNYLKVAIRNLSRDKTFSLINIFGLAVGMGICLLIYQYIDFELSYDKFHPNAQNTYRLTQTETTNREDFGTSVYTTYAVGAKGKETIPGIKQFVRIRPDDLGPVVMNTAKNVIFQEDKVWYVDHNFLQMFDFPLLYGDQALALDRNHHVVITESVAIKYFGSDNPLGKELKFSLGKLGGNFIVAGVLKNLPKNSHLQFDFLLPMPFLLQNFQFYREDDTDGWSMADFITYVTLEKTADPVDISEKFDQLITTHSGKDLEGLIDKKNIQLQAIEDIHLRSDYDRDFASNNGEIQDVNFFAIIAIFILFMAWVNYINLSTARALHRAKEVGVRKSIGAYRGQLMSQFLVESGLVNLIAAILSIGVSFLLLPVLNNIIGKELEFNILQSPEFSVGFSIIIILGTLFSGLYPAFVLSSFKPISILKSPKANLGKGLSLRKGLIVFQFLTSVLLISGTYLVYLQITFMKNQDLGVDMEKIIVLNGPRVFLETLASEGETHGTKYQTFKNKTASHHSVSAISATSSVPSKGYYYTESFRKTGESGNMDKEGNIIIADTDLSDTYDFEFLAKKPISKDIPADRFGIINEEAVKVFGLGSPEEALHKKLTNGWDTLEIMGVVKNFHWTSLKHRHTPLLFFLNNGYGAYFSIKINLSNIQETISHIESSFHSVFPGDPFHYFFLEDDFNQQYRSDLQFGSLFSTFSILAIFIACLGLFALVSFSATLRIREIGIRKVFGANIGNLMVLLSREYVILLLIANVLAIPIIVFGSKSWLDNYAFKISMSADIFLIPALSLVIISLLTVSYRTHAAAKINPANSLRSE